MAERSVSGKALDWPVIRRIFQLVRPYRTVFRISVVLTLLLAVLSPVRPWLIQFTIDNFISKGDYPGLLNMTVVLLSLLIFQSIVQYFNTFLTNRIGQSVVRDLRINLFRHITGFRLKFFDKTPI